MGQVGVLPARTRRMARPRRVAVAATGAVPGRRSDSADTTTHETAGRSPSRWHTTRALPSVVPTIRDRSRERRGVAGGDCGSRTARRRGSCRDDFVTSSRWSWLTDGVPSEACTNQPIPRRLAQPFPWDGIVSEHSPYPFAVSADGPDVRIALSWTRVGCDRLRSQCPLRGGVQGAPPRGSGLRVAPL